MGRSAMLVSGRFLRENSGLPGDLAVSADAYDTTLLAESGARVTGTTPAGRQSTPGRWVGARFDHFEIDAPLGHGGMGDVYLARDRSLDRRVAIKVLPDQYAEQPALYERFVREARAQARLNSPHVAHIYYIGRTPPRAEGHPGSLFFAMELVKGGALGDLLEQGETLDPERARQAMIQVARGLEHALAAGIVHRDIKPSNLLAGEDGSVKIADFGVAKPIDDQVDAKITQDGVVVGSPLYMAPEQARGETVDHRADMYALGCSFYHLLSGEPPFRGATALAIVSSHLVEEPRPLDEVSPKVPQALARIVARLLAKDPAERYSTYAELIQALEAAAPEAIRHAGFWVRGAAVGIDLTLTVCVIGLLGWPGLVLHLVYVTLAHGLRGQTLGKFLLHLEVRRPDGGRLGLGRALARTLTSLWLPFLVGAVILVTEGKLGLKMAIEQMRVQNVETFQALLYAVAVGNALLSLLFMVGLVLAAFHPEKRAAHDLVVGSEVVYRLR
jgi:uncharacterized RDD family membrane protein YckC/tRNA A-37 threonylcarbamoyl transferase component Bud32